MNNVEYENIVNPINSSFMVKRYEHSFFEAPLHIHSQYELITFEKGEGISFVGDSMRRFSPGDFMLVGRNVPHMWLSDDIYYGESRHIISGSTYAQFSESIIPESSDAFPEFRSVHALLQRSKRGLIFKDRDALRSQNRLLVMPNMTNFDKLITLYNILKELSACKYEYLATSQYLDVMIEYEQDRILSTVYTTINNQYREALSLQTISECVGMNPSALCRYFKSKTQKSIFEYLIETRISYAVKLLSMRNISIKNIAYDCGYNNLSLFNRQFKAITGKSPSEYRLIAGNI